MGPDKEREDFREAAGELILGVLVSLFALFVIVESIRMPRRGHLGILMSPGFVPLFTGVVLLILALVVDLRAIKRGGWQGLGDFLDRILRDEENRRFLVILGCMGLYILVLVGRVNFIAATVIYHLVVFTYLRIGGPFKIALFTLIATLLVAVGLPRLFEMPVP